MPDDEVRVTRRCGAATPHGPCRRPVAVAGPCWQHPVPTRGERQVWARDLATQARAAATTPRRTELLPPPLTDRQVESIVETLNRHEVEYVVIGGVACQLHGAPMERSRDADIVVRRSDQNLDHLSHALIELDARLRVQGGPVDGVAVQIDPRLFDRMQTITFVTRDGPVDVCFRPDGTGGYDDLVTGSAGVGLGAQIVPVASLEDVIRSKAAAGREKDIRVLPTLRRYLRGHSRRADHERPD